MAGHDQIFKASGGKLFKPLVQREFWFYDQCLPSAPEEYPQFCPKYFGTAELNHDEWQELKEALTSPRESDSAQPPSRARSRSPPPTPSSSSLQAPLPAGGMALLRSPPRTPSPPVPVSGKGAATGNPPVSNPLLNSSSWSPVFSLSQPFSPSSAEATNPWSKRMGKKHVRRVEKRKQTVHRYLILEDLTAGMQHPCALDVKMGKRQYGDDVPEAKKISQTLKCAATTSKTLGFRLSGYQTWNSFRQTYSYLDKYEGRNLGPDRLLSQLRCFFSDGQTLIFPVIQRVLAQLQQLRDLIAAKPYFRIYSTSLLVVYDGGSRSSSLSTSPLVHVKMIDFAHLQIMSPGDPLDDGYLDGLDNLSDFLQTLIQ
ncbi:MAG: inositol polyphosphate kinase family protein [archaeon]|nr:inositol polyphosphate kinase family protein [archaeon]